MNERAKNPMVLTPMLTLLKKILIFFLTFSTVSSSALLLANDDMGDLLLLCVI